MLKSNPKFCVLFHISHNSNRWLLQDKNWQELLSHARRLDCYKGCGFPGPEARQLGRMETKLDTLLREAAAAGDRARVEEMGRGARN